MKLLYPPSTKSARQNTHRYRQCPIYLTHPSFSSVFFVRNNLTSRVSGPGGNRVRFFIPLFLYI